MRILYATDQVYLQGGAEKILTQKLNYWADVLGADVCLITSEQQGRQPFFKLSDKVKHVDLGIGYPEGSLYHPRNLTRFRTHLTRFRKEVKSFAPDAVFVISQRLFHQISPFAVGDVPVFYEYHTSYYGFELGYKRLSAAGKLKKKFVDAITRLAENKYTGIVFLNQEEYDHYSRSNGLIIPNFFDPAVDPISVPKKKQVISLGRFSYQKGYDLLLESWSRLADAFPDWSLEIYGNGENAQQLQDQIKRLGLTNARVNPATTEVPQKLAESAFYVMSSRFETFPMVLLEALWAGIPVVAFDCPTGPRSMLIENQDGLLASPEDVDGLAEQMKRLMQDAALTEKMGKAGHENVRRFNPKEVMGQWLALVEKHRKHRAAR